MTYYCSRKCQVWHWTHVHKHVCREEGQIEIGDDMQVRENSSMPELNGIFVKVLSRAENVGQWVVEVDGGDGKTLSFASKDLARLRPKED